MASRLRRAVMPIAVLIGGVIIVVVLQITGPKPEPNVEPPRPLSVHAAPVRLTDAQLAVDTNGEVRARFESDVVAQVGGRVIAVSDEFVEGGRFNAGETLLQIEDTDYKTAVLEARARLASARVDLAQALADADVARQQLAGQSNPSPLALKKPQVARAEAAVDAATTNLALAETNLARTRISMPFAGRIQSTSVDLGQFVSPGKSVGKAFSTDRVEIRLPLTDRQLAAMGVPIGYHAADNETGLVVDLSAEIAGQRYYWTGAIKRLDASVSRDTRTIYATAEVDDPYGKLEAMPLAVGLFVDARINGRLVEQALTIPAAGLRAGNQVYVINAEGLLEIRQVDVDFRNSEFAVIASGVALGELVVVSAIRNPIPGMRLQSIEEQLQIDVAGRASVAH
jgi:RND family efflux transporter MFP subunit